jgi:O-antigen/teichoic acid export membrane protein
MVLSLVGIMVVTRVLPARDYGAYVLLRVVALFLGQISGFGTGTALPVFIAGAGDARERRKIFSTILYFRILTIVIVSAVALPLKPLLAALFGAALTPELVVFIPLLFFLESTFILLQSALQSHMLFKKIGASDFVASLLNFVLLLAFVPWLNLGFIGLVYARCIALLLSLAYIYFSLPVEKCIEFHPHILREVLKFGLPLQVNDILTFIFNRIDTVLIGVLLGIEGVGYYEIARKIPDMFTLGFEAYRVVYYPHASRFHAEGQLGSLSRLLNTSNRLFAFATLLGAFVTLLFGRELVFLLFTPEYGPSVSPLIVLMVTLCFYTIGYTLGVSLVAIGDTTKPPLINIVHMVVTIGGNLLLVPRFGITGAALATLAGNIATNPLNVYFLRRRSIAVDVLVYVKPLAIFAVHAVVYIVLSPESLWVRGLLLVPFLLSCVLLSVITRDDTDRLVAEIRPLLSQTLNAMRVRHSRS